MYLRGDRASSKAQISIFLIVGIVLFFIFLLMIQLAGDLQKQQLTNVKEDIYSQIFTKEALRIFVDECLREGMEEGLTLLGTQGRLWDDQPGGRAIFKEGVTGVEYQNERIFYGITREIYSLDSAGVETYSNAYPCNNDDDPEEFCKYEHPDVSVNFGDLTLDKRFIQADLERFLSQHTIQCVENLIRSDVTNADSIETSPDVNFRVSLNTGVINVKVNYPLRIRAGEGEFFHISQFDFTYPSDFDQFLKTAVLFPLRADQKYVNFDFSESTLLDPEFDYEVKLRDVNPIYCDILTRICQQSTRSSLHIGLGLEMKKENIGNNGDTLYKFTMDKGRIIFGSGGEYVYQFVRQNRPPALDYINRNACIDDGYDYLVIPGNDNLGTIDFNLRSLDPDDSSAITYSFDAPANYPIDEDPTDQRYLISEEKVLENVPTNILSGINSFKVITEDNHGQKDWQNVRILVDEPLRTEIKIMNPYIHGAELPLINGKYAVSREDPYFLDLIYITESGNLRNRDVRLLYNNQKGINFGYSFPAGTSGNCLLSPVDRVREGCDINFYNDNSYINNWEFDNQIQRPLGNFVHDNGVFTLEATANYCAGQNQLFFSHEAEIEVMPCYPYRDPNNPAYPNNNVGTNPFLGDHACCLGNAANPSENMPVSNDLDFKDKGPWRLAPTGTACYDDPNPGCYGRLEDYTRSVEDLRGYVVETLQETCDGVRGNVCGGGGRKSILLSGELKCGDPNTELSCDKVEPTCKNKLAWGYATNFLGQRGWCHGKMGCEKFDTLPVVMDYLNSPAVSTSYTINEWARDNQRFDDSDLLLHSGCGSNDNNKLCDANFNGQFNGRCNSRVCVGDS